jgi:hypothetical protein
MRVFDVQIIISGNNEKPEHRVERILAADWQDACQIMAAVSRDTGCVIMEMHISISKSAPFDYRTVKTLDA